jgi:transposase-like protein
MLRSTEWQKKKRLNFSKKSNIILGDNKTRIKKNSSQIIANLTKENTDQQQIFSANKFQKQLSVQNTIQRHFSQILKNDSITVTDNTSITETLLMRENTNTLRKYRVEPESGFNKFLDPMSSNVEIMIIHQEYKILRSLNLTRMIDVCCMTGCVNYDNKKQILLSRNVYSNFFDDRKQDFFLYEKGFKFRFNSINTTNIKWWWK